MVSTPQEERKSNGCGFQPEVNLSNFPSNSRKPLNQVYFGVTCNMATPNEHEKIFKTLIISASPLCRCFKSGFKLFFNHHHHHHRTRNSFLVKAFDILPTGKPARTLTSIYPPIQKNVSFEGCSITGSPTNFLIPRCIEILRQHSEPDGAHLTMEC